ncbi:MAG: DUF3822 family protein [Bacteroidetes bacterium]|nr:DUF3822 family protein [Bacteroidota bacterium]
MSLISEKLKADYSVGNSFVVGDLQPFRYKLFVTVGQDSFSFALLDHDHNQFCCMKYYDLTFSKSMNEAVNMLNKIIYEEPLLGYQHYKKAVISLESRKNALIPNDFYDSKNLKQYFTLQHDLEGYENLLCDKLKFVEAQNAYAIDSTLLYLLQNNFAQHSQVHHTTALLNSQLLRFKNREENFLLLYILNRTFCVTIMHEGRLLFFNSFAYFNQDDILYHTMNVCEQLHLDLSDLKTEIAYQHPQLSPFHNVLSQYLRDVKLADRTPNHRFAIAFEDIPGYCFPVIFDLDLCV